MDLMVIPLSCSSSLVSVASLLPACFCPMSPALLSRESVSVVLPWSTCAITDMLRIFFFLDIIALTFSAVKFTLKKKSRFFFSFFTSSYKIVTINILGGINEILRTQTYTFLGMGVKNNNTVIWENFITFE